MEIEDILAQAVEDVKQFRKENPNGVVIIW